MSTSENSSSSSEPPSPMASQESVDQLTLLMTQIQQTLLTIQNNITQLQNQQCQLIQNLVLPQNDPQHLPPDPLNDPPPNPLPPFILPQNQPDPVKDELEKIESVLLKTSKATKMTNQPTETKQDQLVIKILQAQVKEHSFVQPIATLPQLYATGIQVEDAIHSGILDRGGPNVRLPKKFGDNPLSNPNSHSEEVNAIDTQVLQKPSSSQRTQRTFTPLKMSLSEALDRLVTTKHLTLLKPSPPPKFLPRNYDPSKYCEYHQGHGHNTNNCIRLRCSIQDLIDTKKIAPPNSKPNITTNPFHNHNSLHNHNRAVPSLNINLIDDIPPFDPSLFIIPLTEPKPIVSLLFKPEHCLIGIPDPESDDDSDGSDMMNKLCHFDELDVNDVEFEWFNPNKVVDSNGWNEMTKTEAKPKTEKDWADDAESMAMEILFNPLDQVDWCDDAVMMLGTAGAKDCCGLIMNRS